MLVVYSVCCLLPTRIRTLRGSVNLGKKCIHLLGVLICEFEGYLTPCLMNALILTVHWDLHRTEQSLKMYGILRPINLT